MSLRLNSSACLLAQNVRSPITVIPNGIDLSSFKAAKKPGSLRNRLGIKSDAPILLTVGRMDPEKRLDFIVDAFDILSQRVPNAHLVFAGDGGSRKGLEEKVSGTNVKDRIHFLGMVNRAELPDILHDATVFLSASTTEVHPISVIEAIASGKPLVAVKDEAFEGMIDNDHNGYLTPLDVQVFADTVADLLADREKLERFGKHSMLLSEKYSIEGQVKALEKLYLEAILQNWRGNFFQRMMSNNMNNMNKIPRRINRMIRTEIGKMMPRKKKKK